MTISVDGFTFSDLNKNRKFDNYKDAATTKKWFRTPANNTSIVTYGKDIYVRYSYFNTFNVKP